MLIFLVWYVQRITKTLASPGLLGTSVQCMVLYWLLVEICRNLHWRENCTTSIPFLYVCEDVMLVLPVMYTWTNTIRRPCHIVRFGFCLFHVCDPSPPFCRLCVPSLTHAYTHRCRLMIDHSFCCHAYYGKSNHLRVSCLYYMCVFLWCNIS